MTAFLTDYSDFRYRFTKQRHSLRTSNTITSKGPINPIIVHIIITTIEGKSHPEMSKKFCITINMDLSPPMSLNQSI